MLDNTSQRHANDRGGVVLILSIIVTILVLGTIVGLQIELNNSSFSQSTARDIDMTLLQNVVDSMLKNESSCRVAFGGPLTYNGPLTGKQMTFNPAVGAKSPVTLYQSDGATVALQAAASYTAGMCPSPGSVNCFGKLAITEISITTDPAHPAALPNSPPGKPVYMVDMTIAGVKDLGATMGGAATSRANIIMTVQLDGSNNVISCSSLTFLGSDVQPLPICNTNEALSSNGHQIRCIVVVCPAGKTVTGYQGDGSVICN